MADIEAEPPQSNGYANTNDDDDERGKMRPADIDADVREMERRKRVEMIMNSRLFREELERIIEVQMKDGGSVPAGLLQQISEMMGGRPSGGSKSSNCVVPINDIRGVESMGYAKGEKIIRCKLAAVFRLMDLYGWTQGIYNQVSARLNQEEEHFLVSPYGLLCNEVTASSLIKVDMQGNVMEPGTTNYGVNITAFQLHAAIYAARPDLKAIIDVQVGPVLAVSSLRCGLLHISKESALIGDVSHYAYPGSTVDPDEKDKIARSLGPINKVIFFTNHGAVCCGESIEEAFYNAYNIVTACETQLKVLPVGLDNIMQMTDEQCKFIYDAARSPPEGTLPSPLPAGGAVADKRWRVGGLQFEALMRMLDNAGFRTGYIYRQPLIKGEPPRPRNDVEVPPAVSSLGYLLEEEELYKNGQWKKYYDGRKSTDRTKWLNSPNVYQKVEVLETGTTDPKKITKWVSDASPNSSTPFKIEGPLQFVPKNTNPKEFKKLQQQIKENRRADKITSGPQSQILDGVSWEEAKKLQDANLNTNSDQVILVGAASKGIIQRNFQHNATVYKTPYAKNPFDAVTDEEIEYYKNAVERSTLDKDQIMDIKEQLDSVHFSPARQTEAFIISETEDDSRAEARVLQVERKSVLKPDQAEFVLSEGENTYNGDQSDAHQSTFSSSKEGSPTKEMSTEDSSHKDKKKKKKGIRTPSFLKKKKEKKKSIPA
ncbi:protein hu-li tai shao [Metopolophium dirhodum]|uniref:protein hu-li tai shao n=1 Tax=Metopolophium dirhodum TaxID=44670 RepID=UPI002990351D|nr:protein hu-li tai shao [Metopolophium dirhodum]XP_060855911.1 protein hu-li tai shao [Metopolophium dirhodum]XP_060855912.1 protein hu-li tai shao [Metopolophium dirhodum]